MIVRPLLLAVALTTAAMRGEAAPLDAKSRSVSSSGQFIVYCPDVALRGRLTGFAEDVKADVLELLGERDRRKIPIILTVDRATGREQPPVQFRMIATPDGTKIEISVEIGEDPAAINLQKQIVRAVLLEIAYRDRPPIKAGERFIEAPWWLVEGALQIFRRRHLGVDSDLFQRLVENNKLPSLEQFLGMRGGGLGATAEAIDAACAMGLVQALIEQPNGKANLGRFVRRWPEMSADPLAALSKDFPGLTAGEGVAQKWWTLNLARFAAANRYQGLSAMETDRKLAALLQVELVVDKAGTKKTFALNDYAQFIKLPAARTALKERRLNLVSLSTQANALFRPVVADYEQILNDLSRGKTRRIADRLADVERYRSLILTRMSDIADYLNWYEATQLGERSNAFDSYLKAANELSREDARRSDPIARYLDQLETEF